jgi:hypothetical protein
MGKWNDYPSIELWWNLVAETPDTPRAPLRILLILVSWEIWWECNARIFRNIASTPASIIAKIKEEGRAWVKAGATRL